MYLVTSPASLVRVSVPVRPTTIYNFTKYNKKKVKLNYIMTITSAQEFFKKKRGNFGENELMYKKLVNAHAGIDSNLPTKKAFKFLLLNRIRSFLH